MAAGTSGGVERSRPPPLATPYEGRRDGAAKARYFWPCDMESDDIAPDDIAPFDIALAAGL